MSSPLRGRTAIVTGSTRGIGQGIARALGDAGCNVVLNGRAPRARADPCPRTAYVAADLRDPRAIADLVRAAESRFGRVDILVNNAGIQHVSRVDDFPDEAWEDVIGLNLSAAFRATRAALPGMRSRGWGRIVNIASVHALVASIGKCAYVSAKHGRVGLTKAVALETAGDGITCNAICPGWVLTDLVRAQITANAARDGVPEREARQALLRAKQPLAEFSTPESIGALTVFLCGAEARTMTGAVLSMDGGWSVT